MWALLQGAGMGPHSPIGACTKTGSVIYGPVNDKPERCPSCNANIEPLGR